MGIRDREIELSLVKITGGPVYLKVSKPGSYSRYSARRYIFMRIVFIRILKLNFRNAKNFLRIHLHWHLGTGQYFLEYGTGKFATGALVTFRPSLSYFNQLFCPLSTRGHQLF